MRNYSFQSGTGFRKICSKVVMLWCACQALAVCVAIENPHARDTRPIIVIDPGHGGNDIGVTGFSGATEKSITLELAKLLAGELKKSAQVVLTRQDDSELPLTDRTAAANRHRASLFISLHTGASFSRQLSGYAVYHYRPSTRNTLGGPDAAPETRQPSKKPVKWNDAQLSHLKRSEILASMVCGHIKKPYPDVVCNVHGAPLLVLEGAACPAILVESGFLTNPSEEKRLTTARQQSIFVRAIRDAIQQFLRFTSSQ